MPTDDDLVLALSGVTSVFSKLKVPFFVGGSVASSYHGAMRSTMDVDIVAELEMRHVDDLFSAVNNTYYVNRSTIETSIQSSSCFNLIHLASSFKVDVFISQQRSFDQAAMQRAKMALLGSRPDCDGIEVPIATSEDIILAKLDWFRLGNETSERQWDDLTRMFATNRGNLDHDYLQQYAEDLSVSDLLERLSSQ